MESLVADPHSSATTIMLDAQNVTVGTAVYFQVELDVLYVVILDQR